jgi:hypothetical protein
MKRAFSVVFIICGFTFAALHLVPNLRELENARPTPPAWENNTRRDFRWEGGPPDGNRPPPQFRGGPRFGMRRGPGGPPPGVQAPLKLVAQFDKNGDGWLNSEERQAAREYLAEELAEGRIRRSPGPAPGGRENFAPEPGPKVTPADVKNFPDAGLYDLQVLRTIFVEFDAPDWEKELSDFYHTDVEIPAKITVDGKTLLDVGIHFRGASSFFTAGLGRKHSLSLSTDFIHKDQRLYSYRALDLLNSHEDPTFLRSVLYLQAAREYIPAPKANFVRLVINGENWGIYVNAQQFNQDFVKDSFGTTKGARWKVPGTPRGRGTLEYLGEHPSSYREIYDLKSKEDKKAWRALIDLCRVLNETPAEDLEKELSPVLDIDGVLRFLALENALINCEGYWLRSSDYNIYRDKDDRFHIIPHDTNETYREPEGPGWRSDRPGVELDPLQGADDPSKPLLSKLLAVPSLRAKYLGYIRDIAEKWLDWKKVSPLAEQYQALIAEDVMSDTHKLYNSEMFARAVTEETQQPGFRGPQRTVSLKDFVQQRQKFLLNHPAVKKAAANGVF